MDSGRMPLQVGTRIKLQDGGLYQITGAPIGYGGCSILYPAHRLIGKTGQEHPDGTMYALKECFPAPAHDPFCRSDDGSVVPKTSNDDAWKYLRRLQENMMEESRIVTKVFLKANYILPILESADSITVTLPGQAPSVQQNTIVVMHSIREKGTPLHELMKLHSRFKPAEAFRILQQLLIALKEIHQTGYLHLDIKPSNIFLRGSLSDGFNMLTLMDLGSAKEWRENQKTDPLHAQELPVSEGFCPPETNPNSRLLLAEMGILPKTLADENNIRLGVEADLYQAACLLRYLLTGSKRSSQQLLICLKDHYLRPREAAWLKCSVTTTESIQRLLTRALDPDPEMRYHSADEMLQEVNNILDVLNSKPVDLGSVKYDAFICYKHGSVDSIVARKLQQMLEHYRAPRLENVPRKPFHRIFVDEGELSSCADMGQEIENALKNSACLIVLCSQETPNSPWVEREIKLFRQYHRDGKILTVLTGGTPETSYPAALISEGRHPEDQYSPKVQSRYAWRIIAKLRRGEILRLVAPMLSNVHLDDLLQRKKVYRRRRAAVTAVCLSIIAAISISRTLLIARQAAKIEAEHAAAQHNASLYLTEQAQLRLQDNDRPGALELLLEALPALEEGYTPAPQTEYQLTQALGAYVSPYRSGKIYTDTGKIRPAYADFFLDQSGEYLFSWNAASETMDIWNAQTMTPHCTVNVPLATVEQYMQRTVDFSSLTSLLTPREYACETSADFLLPDTSTLICRGRGQVTGLDYISGDCRWTVAMDCAVTMAINESKTHLVVLSEAETDRRALTAHILNAETGQTLRNVSLRIDSDWFVSAGMQISDDLKWAAIPVQEAKSQSVYFPHQQLYLVDLETGEARLLQLKEGQIASIKFVTNKLVLQHYDNFTFTMIGTNGSEISKVPDSKVSMSAYDPASGSLIWQQELTYYCWDSYSQGILPVAYDTGVRTGQGILFYWERFAILADLETGEILHSYEFPDGILEMKVRDNSWCATLCDGTEAMSDYDSDNLYRNRLVSVPLTGGCSRDRIFFLQHKDGSIIRYEENCFDENYEHRGDLENVSWQLYDVSTQKNGYELLLADYSQVAILHTGDQSVLYHSVPHFSPRNILGLSNDHQLLYWNDNQNTSVVWSLDLSSGAIEEYALPLTDREISWWDPVWLEGQIVYAAMRFTEGEQNELTIYSWNPQTLKPKELYRTYLSGKSDAIQWNTFLGDPGNSACFLAISEVDKLRPNRLLFLDLHSKSTTEIPVDFLPELQNDDVESTILQAGAWQNGGYCWSIGGKLAVISFGDTAYCVDAGGEVLCQIPLRETVVASCISADSKNLFLAEADGTISRWRLPDGLWMGSIALKDYCGTETLSGSRFRWEFRNDTEVAVYTDTETLLLDLSGNTLAVKACVADARLLDENDQFWILEDPQDEGVTHIGTFPRYHAENLQKMAQAVLS